MKNLIKQLLREELEFVDDTRDYHKGQAYKNIGLYDDDNLVAYADYSVYNDTVHIDMIEALEKGKGYGQMIMKHLADMYGYENLERSSLTDDGAKMRAKLDKHFNFDYNQNKIDKSKNLKINAIDNIPNPTIKNFIFDMMKNDYQETWKKYLNDPEFIRLQNEVLPQYDIDFNDVADISEWVLGSVTNTHQLEDEVPLHTLKELGKLYKIK